MSQTHGLTRDEIRAIVSEGVTDALTRLGIQVDDPLEMQRDLAHLREWRQSMEQVKKKGILTAIGIVVAGLCSAVFLGLKTLFQH